LAVQQAELAVHQAEAELKDAVNRQADPEIYANPDKAAAQAALCKRLEEKLDRLFIRWDRAEQALKNAYEQLESR
jgi:Tfp pilus assembly protein PilX